MASASAPWIVGPRYDLTWFFGGAAASLLLLGLYAAGVSIVVLFWVWLLAFDGPHIAAAYTRTYLDRAEWRQRRGLVWFHDRNRYGREGDFGPARQLARSPWGYLAACLGFSLVVYLGIACSTSAFPACQVLPGERLGPFTLSQLGPCLWWGLAIHHYYLDQRIWRVSRDPELRSNLGLA